MGVTLDTVFTWSGFWAHDPDAIDNIRVEEAEASDPKDKDKLLDYIARIPGGCDTVNSIVSDVAKAGMSTAVARAAVRMLSFVVMTCWVMLTLMVGTSPYDPSAIFVYTSFRWTVFAVLLVGVVVELKTPRSVWSCAMPCRFICLLRFLLRPSGARALLGLVLGMIGAFSTPWMVRWISRLVSTLLADLGTSDLVDVISEYGMSLVIVLLAAMISPLAPLLRCSRVCLEGRVCSFRLNVGPLRCAAHTFVSAVLLLALPDILIAYAAYHHSYDRPWTVTPLSLALSSPWLWPLLAWAWTRCRQPSQATSHSSPAETELPLHL